MSDVPRLLEIMRGANEQPPGYDASRMAGGEFYVLECGGRVLGYIRFDVGRPESYIRSVAADMTLPLGMRSRVLRRLMGFACACALAAGAEGIQGTTASERVATIARRTGGTAVPAIRVRWRLTDRTLRLCGLLPGCLAQGRASGRT